MDLMYLEFEDGEEVTKKDYLSDAVTEVEDRVVALIEKTFPDIADKLVCTGIYYTPHEFEILSFNTHLISNLYLVIGFEIKEDETVDVVMIKTSFYPHNRFSILPEICKVIIGALNRVQLPFRICLPDYLAGGENATDTIGWNKIASDLAGVRFDTVKSDSILVMLEDANT